MSQRGPTVTGYCSATSTGAIPAGTVTLAVRVGPAAGFAACQCRTGYLGGTGLLEAEELP